MEIALEELEECVSGEQSIEDTILRKETAAALNRFLASLSKDERKVFLCRYWYVNSLSDIAGRTGYSVGKVKSMLFRLRKRLGDQLAEEGLR